MRPWLFLMVLLMAAPGWTWGPGQHTWALPWSWAGALPHAQLGLALASGGDLNGDGIDDVVCAAPFDSTPGTRLGAVYIVFGSPAGWNPETPIASAAQVRLWGEAEDDHPGGDDAGGADGVAIVPSINGDPYDDLVIVSPDHDQAGQDFGKVYIFFGRPTVLWQPSMSLASANVAFVGEQPMGRVSVASAGDVNGDGLGDFVVGTAGVWPSSSGKAYLFLGRTTWPSVVMGISQVASASFVDDQPGSQAGTSVTGVEDLNGDGFDELAVGAPKYTPGGQPFAGRAYVIFGRPTGWTLNQSLASSSRIIFGENPGDMVGYRVEGMGDADGDGRGDLLVSTSNPSETGRVLLFLGNGLAASPSQIPASAAHTQLLGADFTTGDALAFLGDVNGDGLDDMGIGAPLFHNGVGKAYALWGRASWPPVVEIESAQGAWEGVAGKFWAGSSVVGGDVNGDGYADVVLSAAADPFAGYDAGAVFIAPSVWAPGADHTAPLPVTQFAAQVTPSSATLDWGPVWADQSGMPEQVLFYRVLAYSYLRSLDEPPEVTFQHMFPAVPHPQHTVLDPTWTPWDEVVSVNPPVHILQYRFYRILAVDRMGNVSQSAPFTIRQLELEIP